jgi:hypothetical protein
LEVESGREGILFGGWEMLVRLRRLKRAAEMVVIPDIGHGSHNVQNPRQALFSQQGAVDWFDFWLNGHEDSVPSKQAQYARWRKLRVIQDAVRPRLRSAH